MGWPYDRIDIETDISQLFHLPEGFLFVVLENEQVIGCGGVVPHTNNIGIVKRFYIAPEYRGKGTAQVLLNKIIDEAKSRQMDKLILDVYFKNARAAKFYEKHGFKRYTQEPVDGWDESHAPDKFFYYSLDL